MVSTRPPRRAAAIQAHRRFTARRNHNGAIIQLGAPPAPPTQLPQCPICRDVVREHQEREMCQTCNVWYHYACTRHYNGPIDRACRGLCGWYPPDDHDDNASDDEYEDDCYSCGNTFRLDEAQTRTRWIQIFNTQAWARYVRKLTAVPNRRRMNPHIDRANQHFAASYKPTDPWFLDMTADNSRRSRRIIDQLQQIFQNTYNSPGYPLLLNVAARNWWSTQRANGFNDRSLRGIWFIVHPSEHTIAIPTVSNQQYMFSDLNFIMHLNGKAWKGFCKIFDDFTLNLAVM